MKLSLLLPLAAASVAYGYVVSQCNNDVIGDFKSDGSCTGIAAVSQISYQSDIGCVLSTYSDEHCNGEKAVTRSQNACFSPGYQIKGVICH